jgi:phosphatidylcholine synthase
MLFGWLVHLYTASGLVLAFLATRAVFVDEYRAAFFWLALQIVVDATDGALARRAQVSTRLPWFNGAKLDDITDYLTYVFVPALIVWKASLVPDGWTLVVVSAILLSSAYGFNRADAKTADHFFTGFPSYWNIVVFYLMVARWSGGVTAGILMMFAALVFVPIRYIYPSRTTQWMAVTIGFGLIWAGLMVLMLWQFPDASRGAFWASLAYPAYYFAVSLLLHFRNSRR